MVPDLPGLIAGCPPVRHGKPPWLSERTRRPNSRPRPSTWSGRVHQHPTLAPGRRLASLKLEGDYERGTALLHKLNGRGMGFSVAHGDVFAIEPNRAPVGVAFTLDADGVLMRVKVHEPIETDRLCGAPFVTYELGDLLYCLALLATADRDALPEHPNAIRELWRYVW